MYHDKKSLKNRNVFVPRTKGQESKSVASSYGADCFCFLTSVEDRIVFFNVFFLYTLVSLCKHQTYSLCLI